MCVAKRTKKNMNDEKEMEEKKIHPTIHIKNDDFVDVVFLFLEMNTWVEMYVKKNKVLNVMTDESMKYQTFSKIKFNKTIH